MALADGTEPPWWALGRDPEKAGGFLLVRPPLAAGTSPVPSRTGRRVGPDRPGG